jgi:hypothetical protein
MKTSHVNDILEVFQKHTTSLNLPIVETSKDKRNYQAVRNNIDLYAASDNRTVVFDVCSKDCIIFHGSQKINGREMDCGKLISCPKCNMQRYTACTHPSCKDKPYAGCDPFYTDPITKKMTQHQNRTPVKNLYYRPIAAKLLTLYKVSLTKGNEDLLSYFMAEYRVTRPGAIIDINDGLEVQRQLKEMLAEFERIRLSYRERSTDILYQCSLLLTMFYDGITLFDRKADSLMPMLLSVANCNPSNRSKLGVGMSLLALHNVQAGSGAETYFLKEILAVELLQLEKGIIFKFEHPEDPTQTVKVLLQARLVFAHLDTVELQKLGLLKGANSNDGCVLCESDLRGQHRECLSKRIHVGERIRLHEFHWLRQFGEELKNGLFKVPFSQLDFYMGGINSQIHIQQEFKLATVYKVFDKLNPLHGATIPKDKRLPIIPAIIQRGGTTTASRKDIAKAALPAERNNTDPRLWYNNDFPLADVMDDVYFPTRDTRKQRIYTHLSHENYIKYGNIAEANEEAYIAKKLERGEELPKKMPDFAYRGVHGVCPLLRHLKGFRFERFCYDFMHYISNSGSYFLEFFKGDRGIQDNSRRLCIAQRVFPYLQFTNFAPPWRLFESDIIKIDSLCNCLLIPRGFSNSFNMLFPARRTGHLRASDHLTYMTAFATYFYSFTRMKSTYRSFVARFASDLCRLTQPCLAESELKQLILSIFETGGLREGMFPDSEKQFIFHQIVDIVNNIRNLGHVDGIQCYSGERSLATIGRMLAKGGVHYVKGMFYRYIALENTYLNDTQIKFEFLDNTPPCPLTQKSRQKYSDFVLKLHGHIELITLTHYEVDKLLDCVVNYLETSEIEPLNQKSAFYRLYMCYTHNKKSKSVEFAELEIKSFYSWILAIHNRFCDLRKGQVSLTTVVSEMEELVGIVVCDIAYTLVDIAKFAGNGQLLVTDLDAIVREVALFPTNLNIKTKVFIKGLRFNCRGQSYREIQKPNTLKTAPKGTTIYTDIETNPLNELDRCWWKPEDYSSWCRMEYYTPGDGTTVVKTTEMGQLNFCFRLNWKSDDILYGLAFGNVVIRKTSYNAQRRHHHISPNNSFNASRAFVCLNNVCSTAIGVSVLDEDNLPLLHNSKRNNMSWVKETKFINLAPAGADPHVMYFLELYPHRVSYLYRSIEDDLDGTKNWDIM